eukprot:1251821-Prymnesium_polylepis.1
MHGPAAMVLATRIAQKRSALTHMRAHSCGLVRDATLKTPSLLQTAFEEKTDFFFLTDLPW